MPSLHAQVGAGAALTSAVRTPTAQASFREMRYKPDTPAGTTGVLKGNGGAPFDPR